MVPQREVISHHTSAVTAVEAKFVQQTLPSHRASTPPPPSATDQQPWAEEKNQSEFIQIGFTHGNPIFQATVPK